jgi:hypothetical protein
MKPTRQIRNHSEVSVQKHVFGQIDGRDLTIMHSFYEPRTKNE